MPFFLEAAILSRIRSPVTSRSNWANDRSTFKVRRPIEVVVLKACVTETKDTECRSKTSTILAKSDQRSGEPVNLVDDDDIHPAGGDVG